ncbi:MAG: 2-amino-4-hydroxy-6-hydroxymethyldihydropteridine diphosphokinase [Pseudomonadota bacterium]
MPAPSKTWVPAYIGLGSNIGEPLQQLRSAARALATLPASIGLCLSRLYATAPMGPQDQPEFLNAAAALLTQLTPHALLAALQQVEQSAGRDRSGPRWGPRTLDLDLLFVPGQTINDATLTLPHPGLATRNFVLQPLAELCPDVAAPGLRSVRQLAANAGDAGISRTALTW